MHDRKASGHVANQRPPAVWILTIWLGLFAGLFPLWLWMNAYRHESVREALGVTVWHLVLGVSLGVGIAIAAVLAWKGNHVARYLLIVLATIHYGSLAYTNLTLTFSDTIAAEQVSLTLGRSVRSAVMIPVVIWFLGLSERTQAFYD